MGEEGDGPIGEPSENQCSDFFFFLHQQISRRDEGR